MKHSEFNTGKALKCGSSEYQNKIKKQIKMFLGDLVLEYATANMNVRAHTHTHTHRYALYIHAIFS